MRSSSESPLAFTRKTMMDQNNWLAMRQLSFQAYCSSSQIQCFYKEQRDSVKVFIECFLYINNRIEYNKLSNCMLFLVIFKLTDKIPMNALY